MEFTERDLEQSIPRRFLQQVRRCPDAVAVDFEGVSLTYAELNRAANRVARELREKHPGRGDAPVALLIDQGSLLYVAILAILKLGSSYAPLDRRQPAALLERTLRHLQPGAIISDARNMTVATGLGGAARPVMDIAVMDIESVDAHRCGNDDDIDLATNSSRAYVFYTSGSTGEPKGVVDTHRGVLHNVMRYTNTLGFSPADRMSLVQHSSFSGTVSTLFGGLLNGATVVPFDLDREGLAAVGAWARRERITIFHSVPSVFRHLASDPGAYPELRLIRLEGDAVKPRDIEVFQRKFDPDCVLVNGLGATECGLVTQYVVTRDTRLKGNVVPVGYPVEGMEVRVVDEAGEEVPPGTTGEISVVSRYLASGYWNRPELTAEKFKEEASGRRTYRSGDLGRVHPDGCLEHLGRLDFQTRIGGQPVDTSEVEHVLREMRGVSDVVVQTYTDRASEAHLAAYLVPEDDREITVSDVREFLAVRVGKPAIPTACVFLEELPLTPDGKVDRGGLPAPIGGRPRLGTPYAAPATSTERLLADLWAETLELESRDVGVLDSFFDLGGESRRASQVAARISRHFGKELSPVDLFQHRTIRLLARVLDGGSSRPETDRLADVSERAAKQTAALARRRQTDRRKHGQ